MQTVAARSRLQTAKIFEFLFCSATMNHWAINLGNFYPIRFIMVIQFKSKIKKLIWNFIIVRNVAQSQREKKQENKVVTEQKEGQGKRRDRARGGTGQE